MYVAEQRPLLFSNTSPRGPSERQASPRAFLLFIALAIALSSAAGCSSQPNQGVNNAQTQTELLDRADELYQAKQYSAAKRIYLESVAPEKFSPVTYYRLGNIFYAEKNFIQAQKYYLESLKQKPQSIKTHYNIANVYLRLAEFHLLFFQENTHSKALSQNTQLLLDSIEAFSKNKAKRH